MPSQKSKCSKCLGRHVPPTGKKCKYMTDDHEGAVDSQSAERSVAGSPKKHQPSPQSASDVQQQILVQLQRVNNRLDNMDDEMAEVKRCTGQTKKMSSLSLAQKASKADSSDSDSSSDESLVPSLSHLKSARDIQRQVDNRLRELEECSFTPKGQGKQKFKSKRGGNVDILVHKKVAWPDDTILGGNSKQRVSYDQLSWSQWVQGFVRNILEEKSNKTRKNMLNYLSDLMEDATDFSWQGAKASHAVLLCDMERGDVSWDVVLTESEEHMLKNTFRTLEISVEMVMILAHVPGSVKCFKLGHVLSPRTMRQMGTSKNISVPTAWKRGSS